MPFKSKAQQRFMYAKKPKGVDLKEWSDSTDFKHLPAHATKKHEKKAMYEANDKIAGALGTLAGGLIGAGLGAGAGAVGGAILPPAAAMAEGEMRGEMSPGSSYVGHYAMPDTMHALDSGIDPHHAFINDEVRNTTLGAGLGATIGGLGGANIGHALSKDRGVAKAASLDKNTQSHWATEYFSNKLANELSSESRSDLSKGQFAIPEGRKYPIHDEVHARNALARVSQFGSSDEKARVRAAVHSKYPHIGEE
jgi:uncharacterized protein YcfJ